LGKELHVWPYLVRIEFLVTVIVTVILLSGRCLLNAPLEEPGQPQLDDESFEKRPWYFSGCRRCSVNFDPGLRA